MYYSTDFELCCFLRSYRGAIDPGGLVVFDMVDLAFDQMQIIKSAMARAFRSAASRLSWAGIASSMWLTWWT